MASHKTENSSFQIKGYVNKLYGEIVEEMDTFLSDRDVPSAKKPFSATFSELGKALPSSKRPNALAWGNRGNLRNKYFSFGNKQAEKPSSLLREPSSRFLSSFEKQEDAKGFDSRKYFAPETDKALLGAKSPATPAKTSFHGEWQSIWTKPLAEKTQEKTNPSEVPPRTSLFTAPSVFADTTSNIIPSLKSSLETILGGENKRAIYSPISLKPSPKTASTVEIRENEISSPERESLLSPLAGMISPENKSNSFTEKNLEEEIEDFIASPSRLVLQEGFWRTLEQEESLGELFDGVEPSAPASSGIFQPELFKATSEELAQRVAKENTPASLPAEVDLSDEIEFYSPAETPSREAHAMANQAREAEELSVPSPDQEEMSDPFFDSLEEAFAVPAPISPETNPSQARAETPLDLEPLALNQQASVSPDLGSLEWAGELRWHLVQKSELASFEENLPAGFVLCDGSSLLGQGALKMNAHQIVGKLPRWIEDVDVSHIVVGIMRAHKS